MVEALVTVTVGAALGFITGVAVRTREATRQQRAKLFADEIPACRDEIAQYVERLRTDGPIASMTVEALATQLHATYRAAIVASRTDEAFARPLTQAAWDLHNAAARIDNDETPRRIREGGWSRLAWDTIRQAEKALACYERWLARRLLAPRLKRQRAEYQSIQIDRDLDGEDPSRFARPATLTKECLEDLLDVPVMSWAVVTGIPLYERVLLIWISELDHQVTQRLYETDDDWLHPLGNDHDPEYPRLWRLAATLSQDVVIPDERQVVSPTLVIADHPITPATRAELNDAMERHQGESG